MRKILFLVMLMLFVPLSAQSVEYSWSNAKGESVSLEKIKGEPVILHFWASWCPPCRTEMPAMDAWMKANPDIQVVVISLDSNQEYAQEFYTDKGIQAPLNMGAMRDTSRLGVRGLPSTIIINAQGEITKRHMGDLDWADAKVNQMVRSWLLH